MSAQTGTPNELYGSLLDGWNRRDAAGMAALFGESGSLIGFDGSTVEGREAIEAHLAPIFRDHPTPAFIGSVREARPLAADLWMLRAVAGMVPSGASDLDPALNAVQTLVASRRDDQWRIELFQNTPASFHGRPADSERLTRELREVLRGGSTVRF